MIILFLLFGLFDAKISPSLQYWIKTNPPETKVKVWVYFTDKGFSTQSEYDMAISELKSKLTPGAIKRRLNVRSADNLVDLSDLPVAERYVNSISKLGATPLYSSKYLNATSFLVPVKLIQEIASFPYVLKIDKIRTLKTTISQPVMKTEKGIGYGESGSALKQIGVADAHSSGFIGSGVLIGILDTGFERKKNPAFKYTNIIREWDFINNDNCTGYDPTNDTIGTDWDQINHGTGMLCLLGAAWPDNYIGAAFGSDFVLAKTEWLRNPGSPYADVITEEDWWIAGVEWIVSIADTVANDSACIISNSLGYKFWADEPDSNYSYDMLNGHTTPISRVASSLASKGVLLVTAMGNRKDQSASPDTCIVAPADADSIIAVGGVDSLGNWVEWEKVGNVNYGGSVIGPRVDGTLKPEVCGPWLGNYVVYDDTTSYHYQSHGTSCATALVAGACALVCEAHPSWSPMKVREAICNTASRASSPNDTLGYGIMNANKAIGVPDVIRPRFVKDELLPPYPNPFRPGVGNKLYLPYQLIYNSYVRIRVYTLSGRLVFKKEIDEQGMGRHWVEWNGKEGDNFIGSGIYICALKTGYGKDIKKFAVVR
ncbi:MAG: S8 family peptidase [bacterium]|nr:S8 family peptidase [bacterium]